MIFFGNTYVSLGQSKSDENIKVGLVLSGGGAKGLAHIGVLKMIDEAGLRLDYIAGSSMGAVIGGLYASGYTGKQIDSLFYTVDFDNLIQDKLSRRRKSFYEKDDAEKYALTLPIIDGKPSLPKAISNGQNFYNFYSRVTAHVKDVRDFSKLPIPFFCTATNIETGEGVIFDKGLLPDVVAASGALPTVYSPVWHDGKLITDGGVTDNYPVDEIRKRGVEFVIGVDVQDSLMNRSQLKSVTDIMLQISNFRTINAMKTKALKTDMYIRPNIKRFNVVSFDRGKEIIDEGENTASIYFEALKEIAKKQGNTTARNEIVPITKIHLDDLIVDDTKNYTLSYVKGKTKLRTPCDVSLEKLNDGLNNLYSTKNFDNIRYKIITDSTKKSVFHLQLNPNKTKSYLRFGLHYDNLYKTAALINYTHKNLFTRNDAVSIDAILGDQPRYNIDYYIDNSYNWSTGISHRLYRYERAINFETASSRRNLPNSNANFIDLEYLDITTQLYFETLLNNAFAFRLGAEQKYLNIKTPTIGVDEDNVPGTLLDKINYLGAFSSIKYDSLNDKYFPSKGVFFSAALNAYPIATNFDDNFKEFAIIKSELMWAKSIGRHVSLVANASGGLRLGNTDGINSLDFFLGGYGSKSINNQVAFYGRDFFDLSGSEYLKVGATIDFKFSKKHHINANANYAKISDNIFKIRDNVEFPIVSGYAIGYGYESILGPVQLKYSFSPDQGIDGNLFISVGYWF